MPVKMAYAPHGNSKNDQQLYCRTQSSTIKAMKDEILSVTPKQLLNKTYEKAGGCYMLKVLVK